MIYLSDDIVVVGSESSDAAADALQIHYEPLEPTELYLEKYDSGYRDVGGD